MNLNVYHLGKEDLPAKKSFLFLSISQLNTKVQYK